MPEISQLIRPSTRRLTVIGGCGVMAALLWIATGILALLVGSGEVPRVVFQFVAYAAIAVTVSTVILATSYLGQQSGADNHAVILTAIARVAAQQEQLACTFGKINPSKIYGDAVEDLLGSGDRS
ncbi:MAG TPA: hypothetical protein VFR67_14225 [Pilimelia sp.]|nr:hypothetical protein [Pilimelia sp.]